MEKEIMIYGAGNYGEVLYNFLKDLGAMNISCFLETNVEAYKEMFGIPVFSIKSLAYRATENIMIFLAIGNQDTCNDIRLMLWKYGIKNDQIIFSAEFIENNNIFRKYRKFCVLCNRYVDQFIPGGVKQELFERNHIIGGGYRNNCICSNCKGNDRERWLYYVLKRYTNIFDEACTLLHFAPEGNVSKKIVIQNPSCQYFTADIEKRRAQYVVDMTKIQFPDEFFDYIIANHVLEHIEDEKKAVSELMRVLKRDGVLILSFPVCTDKNTFEDKTLQTEEERLMAYGQSDHVRLYGKDYKLRFEKYGLKVQVVSPYMEFGEKEIDELGFIRDDTLMICTR